MLLIAGAEDHQVPAAMVRENHSNYARSSAITACKEFPHRSHLLIASRDDRKWRIRRSRGRRIPQAARVRPLARNPQPRSLRAGHMRILAIAYNAFLQGQFRSSEVEVSSSEVERIIGEAWLGVTWQISSEFRLSYVARYQTREIKSGPGNRDLLWAGFLVSRDL